MSSKNYPEKYQGKDKCEIPDFFEETILDLFEYFAQTGVTFSKQIS